MSTVFRYALIGLAVLLVQWLVLGRLMLWGAYPDLVLLFVAWIGLYFGKRTGAVAGFAMGFWMDVLYDQWGVFMFAKTLVGYTAGRVPATERDTMRIIPRQAFLGGLAVALMHNGIVVLLKIIEKGTPDLHMITSLWLGSAVYTACLAMLGVLFASRG